MGSDGINQLNYMNVHERHYLTAPGLQFSKRQAKRHLELVRGCPLARQWDKQVDDFLPLRLHISKLMRRHDANHKPWR